MCAQQPVQVELLQRCQQLQSRLSTLRIENEEVSTHTHPHTHTHTHTHTHSHTLTHTHTPTHIAYCWTHLAKEKEGKIDTTIPPYISLSPLLRCYLEIGRAHV